LVKAQGQSLRGARGPRPAAGRGRRTGQHRPV